MMQRWSLVAGLTVVGVGLGASEAGACDDEPQQEPRVVVEAGGTATSDGVLVAGVEGQLDRDDAVVTVTRLGAPVSGSIEFVDLVDYGYAALIVFHPDDALEVGEQYDLAVDGEPVGSVEIVEGDMSELGLALELWSLDTRNMRGYGRRACCTIDTSGSAYDCNNGLVEEQVPEDADSRVVCAGTEARDVIDFSLYIEPGVVGPRAAAYTSTHFEVFSGVDGVADTFVGRGQVDDLDALLSRSIDEQAGSYCFRLDVVNAADGTRDSTLRCEDDPGFVLESAPDQYFDVTLPGECIEPLFWEDTGEPVEAGEVPFYDGPLEAPESSCTCRSGRSPGAVLLLGLAVLGLHRRRRSADRSRAQRRERRSADSTL